MSSQLDKKNPLFSKTILVAALNGAVAYLFPDFAELIKDYPDVYAGAISVVFIILRFMTTKGIK